jgi:hypothetical protein
MVPRDVGKCGYHVAMAGDVTNQSTRVEWREPGFFYDRDDQARF